MIKGLFTVLLLVAIAIAAPVSARENQVGGVIMGRVANGTDESIVYAGKDVEIMVFSKGGKLEKKTAATSDGEGRFRFSGLSLDPEYIYMVTVNYKNVLYHSGRILFKDAKEIESRVTIYETTDSDEGIVVESEHLIIERDQEGLSIVQIVGLNNKGNRTYVGRKQDGTGKAETLYFGLPSGYADLKFMQLFAPQQIRQEPEGFAVSQPVVPGKSQFNFSFQLPVSAAAKGWVKKIRYPTETINILYNDPTLSIVSDKLTDMGPMSFGERKYLVMTGKGLTNGTSITISLGDGSKESSWIAVNQGKLAIIFIVALGAVVGLFLIFKAGAGGGEEEESSTLEEFEAQKSELIMSIALLDDRFEAGGLSQEEYDRERNEKKARLLEVARMIENTRGESD